jgi:hypothetical protein
VRAWLVVAATAGCTASLDAPLTSLQIEPPAIELAIELGSSSPAVPIQVLARSVDGELTDVSDLVTFSLDGAPVGSMVAGQLASDGVTGGSATLTASYRGLAATAPVSASVYSRRTVDGTSPGAAAAFAAATTSPVDANLSPGDGSVLPPDLGALELDFGAADLDDTHEVHVTAPYLDIAVDAPGVAGPREIALAPIEWEAISRTTRGGSFAVDVASLDSSAPATARVASASYDVADLDASALLVGVMVDATAQPEFERYDMATATLTPMLSGPSGGCVGCHVAVSADGTRITAGMASALGGPGGILFDAQSGAVLATSDASASPWVIAGFDPSGAMIAANNGTLTLRDGSTAAVIAELATGELATSPTVSPDGSSLAYAELDTADDAIQNPLGNAIHVRAWNAATASLGAPTELVRDGQGVIMPVYSPDGNWIAYGHTSGTDSEVPTGAAAVRSDGSGTIVELTSDPLDRLARWASPIAPTRAGSRDPEPMVWIAFVTERPFATLAAGTPQLWLEAFYPDRGVLSPAFHLPGQGTVNVIHGPLALPQSSSGAVPNLARSASRPRGPSVAPARCTTASASR